MTVTRGTNDAKGGAHSESGQDADRPTLSHRALGLEDGLEGLRQVMDRLLGDEGCPWDRAQTLESLRPYLLEEAHEVLEAMDDPGRHVGELGDLLFQILFQSALREREGHFDLDGVIAGIRDKMIERHPHVFGPQREPLTEEQVRQRWEAGKQRQKLAQGQGYGLEVPRGLPAIQRSARLQDKAAALGFDWPDVGSVVDKVHEELQELLEAQSQGDSEEIIEELGDLLFVLVRLAGKLRVDPETALTRANAKFERRFGQVLAAAAAAGQDPATLGLSGLDALWNQIKAAERAAAPKRG